jgi:hypothetical protein
MSNRAARRRQARGGNDVAAACAALKLRAQQHPHRSATSEEESRARMTEDAEFYKNFYGGSTESAQQAIIGGWYVCLSIIEWPGGDERWHLSCQLHPVGRSSTEDDWRLLGRIVELLGAPRDPDTPFESTHPNEPHHWDWQAKRIPVTRPAPN